MADGDYQSYLRLLRGFFGEFRAVLREKSQQPPRLGLDYSRAIVVAICIYPNRCLAANSTYRRCNRFLVANLTVFLLTATLAIPHSNNVVDMGDDIAWMIGITLIWTKILYISRRANDIDEVIEDLNYYESRFRPQSRLELSEFEPENVEIRRWQRLCYLVETVILVNLTIFIYLFNLAICVQPLFTGREQPFHVIFPYGWQNSGEHPRTHLLIYVWQILTSQFNLMSICHIDLLGIHTFVHTALNLKIIGLELHKLGKHQISDALFESEFCRIIQYHQHIIRLVEKNNRVFHGTLIAQMIASFALISMSTFETMGASNDPKVAAKFILFMMISFVQLSYWCLAGTMVYSQSMEVAQAAFGLRDWHTKSIRIQRNILFMIHRCQRPLIYAARPFPPFTLATYSIILQQCYRILALLREFM